MLNWYLIYTKANHEDAVASKLVRAGFQVLNPKIRERRYVKNQLKDVLFPLFPCYIFVEFDSSANYRLIKYTRGIKSVVGPENSPTVVSPGIVREIKRRSTAGTHEIKTMSFEPGQEVLIKAGPLEGFMAVFEKELKGTERVSILLKSMGARAVVDPAMLEKA